MSVTPKYLKHHQRRKHLHRSEEDSLYEKLAFSLSSHERVIVGRVESWLGVCGNLYSTENPISQVMLYRSLLKTVRENYHYINPDQMAVIGKRGMDAHLVGLILASGHSPIVPRCGVLITPITDYTKTVSTLAERYLKSYKENESKYVMVNLVQHPLNLLDKSILIIHEYSDSLYAFNHTADLSQFYVRNKIDHDLQHAGEILRTNNIAIYCNKEHKYINLLLPIYQEKNTDKLSADISELQLHPCGASGTLSMEEQVSLIKEVSEFLFDCFNRNSSRWDRIPNFINQN